MKNTKLLLNVLILFTNKMSFAKYILNCTTKFNVDISRIHYTSLYSPQKIPHNLTSFAETLVTLLLFRFYRTGPLTAKQHTLARASLAASASAAMARCS